MKKITRRSFLAAVGLSAALALTACSSTSSSTAASASSTASSAASTAASEASTQAIQALEDLAGKTVGVQLGTTGDLLMSEEVGEGEAWASPAWSSTTRPPTQCRPC